MFSSAANGLTVTSGFVNQNVLGKICVKHLMNVSR